MEGCCEYISTLILVGSYARQWVHINEGERLPLAGRDWRWALIEVQGVGSTPDRLRELRTSETRQEPVSRSARSRPVEPNPRCVKHPVETQSIPGGVVFCALRSRYLPLRRLSDPLTTLPLHSPLPCLDPSCAAPPRVQLMTRPRS